MTIPMATSPIEVNFFTVALPERPLPFFVRDLAEGEKLDAEEVRWTSDTSTSPQAVLVGDGPVGSHEKVEHQHLSVTPSIVKRLVELGLRQSFSRRRYLVHKLKFGFEVFNSDELVRGQVPEFLYLRRGIALSVDHVTFGGPRQVGFFAVPATRQEFRIGLEDHRLAAAAQGHNVSFEAPEGPRRGALLATDSSRSVAVIGHNGHEEEVPTSQVTVPASREIVDAYCRSLSRPALVRDIRNAARAASFRYRPNGQKNIRWLREQVEFVCGWLIAASHNGRVPLTWPHSSIQLSLATKPSVAYERRRP